MAISLTDKAATRARDYLSRHAQAVGLRLGVRKTGCSGFAYTIEYAESVGAGEVVLEAGDVRLIVATEHLPILEGSRIDYVREGLNEKFAFENPNVTSQCGCGGSFSVQ